MKQCPFCAEEIQDEAIKCKHCGEFLDPKRRKAPWLYKTSTLIVLFCMLGPLVLPLVFLNPHYSTKKKITVSVILIIVSWAIYQWLQTFLHSAEQYYQTIFTGQLQL